MQHVQGTFTYFNDDPNNIRNKTAFGGGGLPDIEVYPSVTARFVTRMEPVAVSSKIQWENGVDVSARVWADFPGFTMDFYVSMRMSLRQNMVFHGTEGFITAHAPFNAGAYGQADVELRTNSGGRIIESFFTADQYKNQFDNFHNTVLDGADFPCTLEFSKANQRMIDLVYEGEM